MIRSVVKWSYIKGSRGLARAKAHVNYIQYREGKDRKLGPRTFFNDQSDSISGTIIKGRLEKLDQRGVQIHKIILSPGINSVDTKEYAREVMAKLSRSKGLDLEWYAVIHENTDHFHSHVIVMGTDKHGHAVHMSSQDSLHLRTWGNEYLEREHRSERYLDAELKRLLVEPMRSSPLKYKRTRGDKQFEKLMYGTKKFVWQEIAPSIDHQEWKSFDDDLRNLFSLEENKGHRKTYQQFQTESAGRLIDFHERYQEREMQSYWKDVAESFPGLANDARRELKWIDSLAQERLSSNTDLETLLTGLNPVEHYLRTFLTVEMKRVERDGVNLTKDDDRFEHSTDAFDAQKEQVEKDIFDRLFEEPKDNKADGRDDNARHTREARDR